MRIAVLQSEGRLFPQCKESGQVAVLDVDPVNQSVRQTKLLSPPPQAVGALADLLGRENVEVLLTNGVSQRDREMIEEEGIEVIVGVPSHRVEPVMANYLAGTLQTGQNPCEQTTGGGA
jgi:ATP-binding protein involved in chromosome partitioning